MKLTQEQLDILNHVVMDGQAWVDQCLANPLFSEKTVLDKIKRHKSSYEASKGVGYKNRATRQSEEDAAHEARVQAAIAQGRQLEKEKEEALIEKIVQRLNG